MDAEGKVSTGRKREIDILKGILTITMILCHSIQFFGVEKDPVQGLLVNVINLTTFSGFVFCFGYVGEMAYFQKSWQTAAKKMGKNVLRILIAFYLSGIAYVALVEGKIFRMDFIREVLFLQKYPGWSEFLVSFSAMLLIGIVCFPVFKRMNGKILILCALISGGFCFLPYERITNSWLALLVGSRHFVTFPVLQYSIFFAAGVWFCKNKIRWKWQLLVLCICLGIPCFYSYAQTGYLPERFPVSVWYLFGGCLFAYLYYVLACFLEKVRGRIGKKVIGCFERIGAQSLFYLLFSNLMIFALDCSSFSFRSVGYGYTYFIVILLVTGYFIHILPVVHFKS